jgi:hypothetical protein
VNDSIAASNTFKDCIEVSEIEGLILFMSFKGL